MSCHLCFEQASIRFYPPGKSYANRDDYDGVVSVKWLDDHTVELYLAHGEEGADRLLQSIDECRPLGVTRFKAKRKIGRRMPRPWRIVESNTHEHTWQLDLTPPQDTHELP